MSFSDTFKVLEKPSETNSPGSVQDIIDLTHDADVPVVASALRPLGSPLSAFSVCKDLSSLAYFISLCLTLSGTLATHSARVVWQLVNALQPSPDQDRAEMLLKRMQRKISIITSGTHMASDFSHTRSSPVYQAAELLRSVCDAGFEASNPTTPNWPVKDDQLSAIVPCAYLHALFSPSLAYALATLPPVGITAHFSLLVLVGAAKPKLRMRLHTVLSSLATHQGDSGPFIQLFQKLWDVPFSQISP
jgi:hypothetical protein